MSPCSGIFLCPFTAFSLFPPDGPDTPEIFPPHKYFEEGRSLWLSCQTVSHPKAHYSWNVNGEPWNSRQEVSIHQVGISNNGLYTCLVTNPATGHNNSKVKQVIIVGKWLLVTSRPISGGGGLVFCKERRGGKSTAAVHSCTQSLVLLWGALTQETLSSPEYTDFSLLAWGSTWISKRGTLYAASVRHSWYIPGMRREGSCCSFILCVASHLSHSP